MAFTLFDYIAFMENTENVGKYVYIKKETQTEEGLIITYTKCTLIPNGEIRREEYTIERIREEQDALNKALQEKTEEITMLESL
jgi:hypothetical protein